MTGEHLYPRGTLLVDVPPSFRGIAWDEWVTLRDAQMFARWRQERPPATEAERHAWELDHPVHRGDHRR